MADATRDKLIVALDLPSYDDARALVDSLGETVNFYKIGLELLLVGGLELARELKFDGKRVFLDLKFLDIGNTVERAVAAVAGLGVDFLTVHGHDTKTLKAAVRGRAGSNLKLLAVTVLTNLDQSDLDEQGISANARTTGAPPRKIGERRRIRRRHCFGSGSGRDSRHLGTGVFDRYAGHTPCRCRQRRPKPRDDARRRASRRRRSPCRRPSDQRRKRSKSGRGNLSLAHCRSLSRTPSQWAKFSFRLRTCHILA